MAADAARRPQSSPQLAETSPATLGSSPNAANSNQTPTLQPSTATAANRNYPSASNQASPPQRRFKSAKEWEEMKRLNPHIKDEFIDSPIVSTRPDQFANSPIVSMRRKPRNTKRTSAVGTQRQTRTSSRGAALTTAAKTVRGMRNPVLAGRTLGKLSRPSLAANTNRSIAGWAFFITMNTLYTFAMGIKMYLGIELHTFSVTPIGVVKDLAIEGFTRYKYNMSTDAIIKAALIGTDVLFMCIAILGALLAKLRFTDFVIFSAMLLTLATVTNEYLFFIPWVTIWLVILARAQRKSHS